MAKSETLPIEQRVYEPFPDGECPEGWPTEYVSLADYRVLKNLSDDNYTHYMAWRKRADEAEAKLRWKSAVLEPPQVGYVSCLVMTRSGDPHTRRVEAWSYMKEYDRPVEFCDYMRQWGHANGASLNVEYYLEVPPL